MALTMKCLLGTYTSKRLEQYVKDILDIRDTSVKNDPDIIVVCYSRLIPETEDANIIL